MKNCVIYCTVPNEFNANLLATTLVEEKLAACVNIIPSITSVYKWEGIVQTDNELLLMIKTQESKFEDLKNKIIELHEYTVPEIIAVPIILGNEEYQKWIIKETE
ncbi:MAG: divalent-cation tolerance protein CutA [Clostridium sp.]|nr:divalent-cation tolerance protein CutA [Clostridium sp.]